MERQVALIHHQGVLDAETLPSLDLAGLVRKQSSL